MGVLCLLLAIVCFVYGMELLLRSCIKPLSVFPLLASVVMGMAAFEKLM